MDWTDILSALSRLAASSWIPATTVNLRPRTDWLSSNAKQGVARLVRCAVGKQKKTTDKPTKNWSPQLFQSMEGVGVGDIPKKRSEHLWIT